MKTISRIMIILLAATLIGGVTYAIGNSNWGTAQAAFGGRGGERFSRAAGAVGNGEAAAQPLRTDQHGSRPEHREGGHGGFDRDGGRGFSFFGLLGLARTILPIALIIGVVVLAANGIGQLFNRRKGKSTPVAATIPPVDAVEPSTAAAVTATEPPSIEPLPTDSPLIEPPTSDTTPLDPAPPAETPPANDESTRA